MTYTIYGIRLKGDREVRYVGLTYRDLKTRLRQHRTTPCVRHLMPWLVEHGEQVEVFPIATTENHEEAKTTEKVVISLCVQLNQRLFNRAHVPPHARWEPGEEAAAA